MNKLYFFVGTGLALSLAFSSCSDDEINNSGSATTKSEISGYKDNSACLNIIEDGAADFNEADYQSQTLSDSETKLVVGINGFSLKLLSEVANENIKKNQNTFISPYSLEQSLSILANGANGETFEEIITSLKFSGTRTEFNSSNKILSNLLMKATDETKFENANSLWMNDGLSINRSFYSDVNNFYGTHVYALKFSSKNAGNIINRWCSDMTHGLIDNAVNQGPLDGQLCLANAAYFKSQWLTPFDKELTKKDLFTNTDKKQTKVSMMQTAKPLYALFTSINGAEVASVPFIDGVNMAIILPDEGADLADFVQTVNEETWQQINSSLSVTALNLYMPSFKIDAETQMNNYLNNIGIRSVFTPDADFKRLSPTPLYVNKMYQVSTIDVDENGAEAAAVTITGMMWDSGETHIPQTPVEFRVERPFGV